MSIDFALQAVYDKASKTFLHQGVDVTKLMVQGEIASGHADAEEWTITDSKDGVTVQTEPLSIPALDYRRSDRPDARSRRQTFPSSPCIRDFRKVRSELGGIAPASCALRRFWRLTTRASVCAPSANRNAHAAASACAPRREPDVRRPVGQTGDSRNPRDGASAGQTIYEWPCSVYDCDSRKITCSRRLSAPPARAACAGRCTAL